MRVKLGRLFPAVMSRECGGRPWAATGLRLGEKKRGGGSLPRSRAALSVAVEEKKLGAKVQERTRQRRESAGDFAPAATDPRPRAPCRRPVEQPGDGKGRSRGGSSALPAASRRLPCSAPQLHTPLFPAPGSVRPAQPGQQRRLPSTWRHLGRDAGGDALDAGERAGGDARTPAENINTAILPFQNNIPPAWQPPQPGPPSSTAESGSLSPGGGPGSVPF